MMAEGKEDGLGGSKPGSNNDGHAYRNYTSHTSPKQPYSRRYSNDDDELADLIPASWSTSSLTNTVTPSSSSSSSSLNVPRATYTTPTPSYGNREVLPVQHSRLFWCFLPVAAFLMPALAFKT